MKNNQIKDLYLIGNGFDMHHHVKSDYSLFKDWLKDKDPTVYNRLFQVYECDGGDLWSSLEHNLGNIPVKAVLEDYVYSPFLIFLDQSGENKFLYNLDDFSDESLPEIGFTLQRLYSCLEQLFEAWISQLNEPDCLQRVRLNRENSYFINFNYTDTLESVYAIPQSKIFYIHGSVALNQPLVFGHNQTADDLKRKWNYTSLDEGKEELEDAINDILSLYKDVNAIINNNSRIWEKISNVKNIHVWGLSLTEVDLPYLIHIKDIVDRDTKWEFSWFKDYDKMHKKDIINQLSLENATLIELSDIKIPYPQQLSLFDCNTIDIYE